jgi:hypothetical protein
MEDLQTIFLDGKHDYQDYISGHAGELVFPQLEEDLNDYNF